MQFKPSCHCCKVDDIGQFLCTPLGIILPYIPTPQFVGLESDQMLLGRGCHWELPGTWESSHKFQIQIQSQARNRKERLRDE